MNTSIRIFSLSLLLTLITFALPETAMGQFIQVTGNIVIKGKGKDKDNNPKDIEIPQAATDFFFFYTKEAAQDFTKKFPNIIGGYKLDGTEGAHRVTSGDDGEFAFETLEGSYMVLYHPESKDKPKIEGPITQKNNIFKIKFDNGGGFITPTVHVTPPSVDSITIGGGKTRMYGDIITWNCKFHIPKGYCSDKTRIIVQPYAVSCQDETDIVAYLLPTVMEGNKYHTLQDKRKAYNYKENDPLHVFWDSTFILKKDAPINYSKVITFKRPDQRIYFCPAQIQIEDYTHIIWSREGVFGTCNISTPFKFLEFKLKSSNIPLDKNEFYEVPSTKFRKVDRKLQLQFDKGKATFKADSINELLIQQLAEELISYKSRLATVEITGTASPDGGFKRNYDLARKRADAALRRVLSYVSGNHFQRNINEPKVYTWFDVADSLSAQGYNEESTRLREAATTYGEYDNRTYAVAKGFSIFKDVVEPILEKQRVMICSYNYTNNSALSPEEAVQCWYNDPEYKEGGKQRFSNGDYFNLLTLITDSTEQRKIVERAYKEITKQSGFQWSAFPAYIANRKAIYALEDGIIDTMVLKPFIDFQRRCDMDIQISANNSNKWRVNRSQILINQALFYLKAGKLEYSKFLIDKLPESAEIKREISYYFDMINYVMNFDDPALTDEEKTRGNIGINFVMKTSKVNNAVLKSELFEELEIDPLTVLPHIDLLPDTNPKKWYLKGMLLSKYAGIEDATFASANKEIINLYEAMTNGLTPNDLTKDNITNYRALTEKEEDLVPPDKLNTYYNLLRKFDELIAESSNKEAVPKNDTPHFLAYFQKSFDLNPEYKEYYSHEGNIEKGIFDKFPYKKEEADKYREKFNILVPDFGKEKTVVSPADSILQESSPTENNKVSE